MNDNFDQKKFASDWALLHYNYSNWLFFFIFSVGKTTVSSSLAVELATNQDLKVLIVSTDPAHSLGDALDVDLRRGRGQPIVMTDPLTRGNLYASEVDAEEALNDFNAGEDSSQKKVSSFFK